MALWKKLTIIINEDEKWKGHALHHEIIRYLKEHDVKGMTAYRGLEGFGQTKRLHSSKAFEISASLPIMIDVIEREEKLQEIMPGIKERLTSGIAYFTDVEIMAYGKSGHEGE